MPKDLEQEREQKTFWMNNEGCVVESVGYSCKPANPDIWWFPKLGYSTATVFKNKSEAIKDAEKQCNEMMELWNKRFAQLQKEKELL